MARENLGVISDPPTLAPQPINRMVPSTKLITTDPHRCPTLSMIEPEISVYMRYSPTAASSPTPITGSPLKLPTGAPVLRAASHVRRAA